MQEKTVVIVEDDDPTRENLQEEIKMRGFRARGAGTVAEAYRIIQDLGEETDVMVLDMALEDPDDPETGADIAIRVRDQHPTWLPEYLIITGYPNVLNYYRLALRLGAAAYLARGEVEDEDIVRHIRALALKRSLRVERPAVMEALRSISESTKNLSEAVRKFCREMLAGELTTCLGAPYILLLTDERGTQNVATNTNLPTGYEASYAAIQAMAHAITKPASPHVVSLEDIENLPPPANVVEKEVLARLPGAALLPLGAAMNFRLSLALFVPRPEDLGYTEDTGLLAAVLAQHVRPSIVEHFLGILVHLDSQKRAMLKSISYFCLYVGQDQQRIIDEGVASKELQEESGIHRSLTTMADDLRQTGTILNSAVKSLPQDALTTFEMKDLIEREFADLREVMGLGDFELRIEGSCQVKAGDDLAIAIKRMLQWLAQRRAETPPNLSPAIHVRCMEREYSSVITFEDRSRRLSAKFRERLFEPFSTSVILAAGASSSGPGLYLPMYLAKVLVEEKYGGWLKDESDLMEGETGHRLVMSFGAPPSASGALDRS
ncbi:MAG TPA: hypothetical protein VF543_04500 [Pyrinomonadaceae bacterium]|jgi:ActR/RegA family two-component response regulator